LGKTTISLRTIRERNNFHPRRRCSEVCINLCFIEACLEERFCFISLSALKSLIEEKTLYLTRNLSFNSKPDLVLLFGVTNFFIVKEFVSSNLPVILFCLNAVNAPKSASYYIPKVNTFLLEDFIFVFIVKYTFFAR
jgi:hypothetical protein